LTTATQTTQNTNYGSTMRPETMTSLSDNFVPANNDAYTLAALLDELTDENLTVFATAVAHQPQSMVLE
jgi:hypothetical protein